MSKKILIVESDLNLSGNIREALEPFGLEISETNDGKGTIDRVRNLLPDLVIVGVELGANQNGYLICGKLKKDDALKGIPVFILGNPDGFAQHRKLKTRANEYFAKPVEVSAVVEAVKSTLGVEDASAEEISLDAAEDTVQSAPELELLDSPIEDVTVDEPFSVDEDVQVAPTLTQLMEGAEEAVDLLNDNSVTEVTKNPLSAHQLGRTGSQVDDLRASLEYEKGRAEALEVQLIERNSELETLRASGGKSDRDFFALRESVNKKDKEIVRIKGELHEKDKELVELREKETELEQKLSESQSELQKRDSAVKAANSRADQLTSEKKKNEQQLASAREEVRSALAKVSLLEAEVAKNSESLQALQAQLASTAERENQLIGELEGARAKAAADRDGLEAEVSQLREQLAQQTMRSNDELAQLRTKVSELEEASTQNEERLAKLYQRAKDDEKLREKTKKVLASVMQQLDDPSSATDDESAAA
jgi:DNA-binding response OmpR family regulator